MQSYLLLVEIVFGCHQMADRIQIDKLNKGFCQLLRFFGSCLNSCCSTMIETIFLVLFTADQSKPEQYGILTRALIRTYSSTMRCLYIILGILNYSSAANAEPSPVYSISSQFEAVNAFQEHYNDLYDYTEILVDPSGEWSYKEVAQKKRSISTKHHKSRFQTR